MNSCIQWHRVPRLYQLSSEKKTLHCWLCSTTLYINNHLKRTSAIKVATRKITNNFHYEWKPYMLIKKSTLFTVSKDEWNTKEGTGKSMKNALYVQWYGKKRFSYWSDIKQQKNQACSLSHCRVTLARRHQSVRQLFRQLVSRKFCQVILFYI